MARAGGKGYSRKDSAALPRRRSPGRPTRSRRGRWPMACAPVALALVALLFLPGLPLPGGTGPGGAPASAGDLAAQVPVGDTIQPGDAVLEVRLADGSVLIGRIVAATDDRLTVETVGGTRVDFARDQIRGIRAVRGEMVGGRFWPADPNRSRHFFTATARPLERGTGYLASYMLFFPFVAYGVTDRFSIAGGTPIIPQLIGEIFYLAPKYTVFSRPGLDLAVGTLAFFATRELSEGSLGLLYGVGTFGSPDRAVSGGAGWAYSFSGDRARVENDPVFMLGGEVRVGEHVKLMTENWVVPSSGTVGVLTGGVRLFGERLSGDLGLGLGLDASDVVCCIPVVNFVYNFGSGG
jgi:hypothetical protein